MFTAIRRNIQHQFTATRFPRLIYQHTCQRASLYSELHAHREFIDTSSTVRLKMDSEDEDLRAAIAASLGDAPSPVQRANNQNKSVVDLTGDSDEDVVPIYPKSKSVISSEASREASVVDIADDGDEDLKRAIALSLQESGAHVPSSKPEPTSAPAPDQSQTKDQLEPKSTGGGFLGLDRKKMEEERLARLGKRKPEETSQSDQHELKRARTEPRQSASSIQAKSGPPSSVPFIQFPAGVVKKTFAIGKPRTDDDIRLDEVLQSSDLELAVLSSFMWDMDWLFGKVNLKKSRFILVMQAKDDATVS